MAELYIEEYPYRADATEVFAAIAEQPWAAFLDSGRSSFSGRVDAFLGRYDILVYQPDTIIRTDGGDTVVSGSDGSRTSPDDPFSVIQRVLADLHGYPDVETDLPFIGGALGYFAYDLGRRIEQLPDIAKTTSELPDMQICIYDSALVFDHEQQRTSLVGYGDPEALRKRFAQWRKSLAVERSSDIEPLKAVDKLQSNMGDALYRQQFNRVKKYICDGDVYQINLTQRWSASAKGSGWEAYCLMRNSSPAPFGAYLNFTPTEVLSNSPERFIQLRNRSALASPIKGTRARVREDIGADEANAGTLAESGKDQAENLMIVDLLRNDLGRVCQTGSVEVKTLFEMQSFANVHHLVSTISGKLEKGRDALDLLRACFPGGSVTGAPKIRAMEIIEELEPDRRGIYCGSIGYISFHGDMDTNIAIRTLVREGEELHFSAGGGLVEESDVEEEFQECLLKASVMRAVVSS